MLASYRCLGAPSHIGISACKTFAFHAEALLGAALLSRYRDEAHLALAGVARVHYAAGFAQGQMEALGTLEAVQRQVVVLVQCCEEWE